MGLLALGSAGEGRAAVGAGVSCVGGVEGRDVCVLQSLTVSSAPPDTHTHTHTLTRARAHTHTQPPLCHARRAISDCFIVW